MSQFYQQPQDDSQQRSWKDHPLWSGQPDGGFAQGQGGYFFQGNQQAGGEDDPGQGEYPYQEHGQPGGNQSEQGGYQHIENQPTAGIPNEQGGYPYQEHGQPGGNQLGQGGYSYQEHGQPGGNQPEQGGYPYQEDQQPAGNWSRQREYSYQDEEPPAGTPPWQTAYPYRRNQTSGGRYVPNQGASARRWSQRSTRDFLSTVGKSFADLNEPASVTSVERPFGVTIIAVAVATVGVIDFLLMLFSLCGLSLSSSFISLLAALPAFINMSPSDISAALGLDNFVLLTLYFTLLGIAHLYLARGLWLLKTGAYWGILTIEGFTFFVQLIALLISHQGGSFFANVYLPVLLAGYLLLIPAMRKAFRIPF